jgi:D-alanine-D-alanine ligase
LPAELEARRVDVVFPVTHGPLGEDGCLQGLLEVLDLPYVGSGVLASALGANKPEAKLLFRDAGLPVADGVLVARGQDLALRSRAIRAVLGQAVVVKPAAGGSAIGVTRVRVDDPDAVLQGALASSLANDPRALVERFVPGLEVTCGVLEDGHGQATALPPTLIQSKASDWYDFTSRYRAGGSEHRCPAPLASSVSARVQDVAVRAHRAIGARDLSRVDFVVPSADHPDGVTLLEINTLPGMTATSLFPEAAQVAGISFSRLCDGLVQRALARPRRTPPPALPMP